MRKPEHDEKVLALLTQNPGEAMHYFEVHKRLHIEEAQANQSCNRLVAQGKLRKIRNGIFQALEPVRVEGPWDMSPARPGQYHYIGEAWKAIAQRLASKPIDATQASETINDLNRIRRRLSIPFKDFQ